MSNASHMIIRVSQDCDLFEQIGRDIYFDLVDHDKVRAFRIQKTCPFSQFKEDTAEDFGIPVQFLRFWKWAERQNHTHRPDKPLTPEEELKPVGEIAGGIKSELKLFLEVEFGLVRLFSEVRVQDGTPFSPPVKISEDIMLFFKLYDPEKGALRYVGRLFVKSYAKPSDTLEIIKEMGGISSDEEVDLYEEIEFEPSIQCKLIDKALSFQDQKIEDGNIICFQKTLGKTAESCRYLTVPSFLEHIRARQEMEAQSYPSERFAWKISNFSKLTSKEYYSEVFTIAGCKWEVLIYPKGNVTAADQLSIYLLVADAASMPTGWSRTVDFSLIVVDQCSRDSSIKKETSHEFKVLKDSWGYSSFMPLTKLQDKTKGYLVQDTLVVEANVVVLKAVPPVFAPNSARDAARFISFFDSLGLLFEATQASACVKSPSSGTQTSDAPICLSLEEVESAKQFLKECLPDQFKLSMKDQLASALSTLSVAQTGLSREQKKSVLEFWGHFDDFISDYLILGQVNSECKLLKVQKDLLVSSMMENRGAHLLYKELSEKLTREDEDLQKMLEETRCRNAKLLLDWGALIAKTEETKSNYVSLEQKLAEAEERKRIAEESMSRSTTAWSCLKAQFL